MTKPYRTYIDAPCPDCEGNGWVMACRWHQSNNCDCSESPLECDSCDGKGTVEVEEGEQREPNTAD